jgi:hypothetical protein
MVSGFQTSGGFFHRVDDFATQWANISGGAITVKTTLVADDSNYQFFPCDEVGTYHYDDINTTNLNGYNRNLIGIAVMDGPQFEGTVVLESLGNEDFYVFPPDQFTTNNPSWETSACAAFYANWQGSSWVVPWFWDGTAQLVISPYGNYWHNGKEWDKGWNSSLSITNNGSQSTTYTLDYIHAGGSSVIAKNPSSCVESDPLIQSRSFSLSPSNVWSGTLGTDILSYNPSGSVTSDVLAEDGFFVISLNPVIAGTTPYQSIAPNASGSFSNCGGVCSIPTQCQQ